MNRPRLTADARHGSLDGRRISDIGADADGSCICSHWKAPSRRHVVACVKVEDGDGGALRREAHGDTEADARAPARDGSDPGLESRHVRSFMF